MLLPISPVAIGRRSRVTFGCSLSPLTDSHLSDSHLYRDPFPSTLAPSAVPGEWKNDVPDGKGRISFVTGGEYTGRVANGQRVGRGVYTQANGDTYDGEWVADLQEGRGSSTSPSKDGGDTQTVSYYRQGVMSGEGVTWSNGRKRAWLLADGKRVEEVDLKKALQIVASIGLTVRNPPRPGK